MNDTSAPPSTAAESYSALLAHELRTPLTAVLGYLQLLEDNSLLDDPDMLRQYLAVVRGRAADLARIVSELTTFADLTAGRTPEQRESPATVPGIVAHLSAGRRVRVEASADASTAQVEDDRLRLVLSQLLDNAWKFGDPAAEVFVRAEMEGEPPRVVIHVVSQGNAIPEALREAIFDPFRQVEPFATRRYGGLGLGLTVARRAAEGAGGTLVLEPGAPTRFRLELPLREDSVSREARALREQLARADAQALRAIQDLRVLREAARREQQTRELAEGQSLRAVQDLRTEHRRAVGLAQRLERSYMDTSVALAKAVEARDLYTGGHVERVRRYSLELAETLGFPSDQLLQLEFGAVLHDVGKIGVTDAVLLKPGPLDDEEWQVMRRHPEIGRRVLEGIAFLGPALDAVAHHHERWDGKGYPQGLHGEGIPLFGRIVGVVDAFDAMATDRPYRPGLPMAVVLAEMERGRGSQFDPEMAEAFLAHPPEVVRQWPRLAEGVRAL